MTVMAQMEEANLQEFSLECMESMKTHLITCLFPVSNASKHVQLRPEALFLVCHRG